MKLGELLFKTVETSQGSAFVSDGMDLFSDEEVIKQARSVLIHTERTAQQLRSFIRKYEPRIKEDVRNGEYE